MAEAHWSLSVVIPVYGGAGWIGRCLTHLDEGVRRGRREGGLDAVEVVVVDDGSPDGTADEVLDAAARLPELGVRLVRQDNAGRFAARENGLAQVRHGHVLFIDTRVFLHPDALAFVGPLLVDPHRQVWTSHVVAQTEGNPLAGFWQAIEHVAWRRYFREPRTTSFGIEEFDWYPKGTTALLGPRQLFLDAFDAFVPTVDDLAKANDDTAVLRWVAERTPINISPSYGSTYNARTTLPAFLRHAQHRGTVLVDGYLRPGARFRRAIQAVLVATPVVAVVAVLRPGLALGAAAAGSVAAGAGARALGASRHDAAVLGRYAVPFGVAYLSGLWRGAVLRVRSARRG